MFLSSLLLLFYQIIIALIRVICLLISIAYFTLAERKVMGAIHRRRGPNTEGFWGLLQPLFDGAKLIFKEMIVPTSANKRIFLLAPFIILIISLSSWTLIPFGLYEPLQDISFDTAVLGLAYECSFNGLQFGISLPFSYQEVEEFFEDLPEKFWTVSNFHNYFFNLEFSATSSYGLIILLAFSSLNVYSIIIAGWASSSKYAFLGALRSASQMVSYEVALSVVVLSIVTMSGSFDLTTLVWMQNQTVWFIFPLFPIFIIFFISALAETNRAPFDLPEAEAELVAGYNVEYSAIIFAMFFLAEYCNMILMSLFTALAFLGGWGVPFLGLVLSPFFASFVLSFKTVIFCVFFIIVRASFPRYRYDQLMDLGWKVLMPIATGFFLFEVGVLWTFQWLPLPFDNLPPTWYQPANFFYDPEENYIVGTPAELYFSLFYPTEIFYNFRINSFFCYVVTTGVLICATLVLVFGHPVHSLLALICSFMQLTLLMVCNKIEYFGFVFLIVYVGAVSILFLFILMLFDLSVAFQQRYSLSFKKKVFSSIFILTTLKLYTLFNTKLSSMCELYLLKPEALLGGRILNSMMFDFNEIFPISLELYKFYALPFFFIVMLLLSAMLGSIIIAMNASSGVFCRYNIYRRLKIVLFQSLNPLHFPIFLKARFLILKVLLRISDFNQIEDVKVYRSDRLEWYTWSLPAVHKHIVTYSLTASYLVLKPLDCLKPIKLQNVV